ncbi:MAG: PAC2 family protein [Actinobacteria bacterium]|nr:PAC2 family protein [Actinomycetota bacterium]
MRDGATDCVKWGRGDVPSGPTMVVAFKGWNDAGNAASAALNYLAHDSDRRLIAELDPENFYDFQSHRPQIAVVEGELSKIEWPRNVFHEVEVAGLATGALLLEGEEPSMHWGTFCDAIIHVAKECEVENVVMLGALLADVPHTRPSTINSIATDPEIVEGLGFRAANYEGPTGITGVVQNAFEEAGLRACSLWAAVPHYVAATPNPPAALALVHAFEGVTGADIDVAELEASAERFRDQVSAAVAQDDEISGYVRTLEESADEEDASLGASQLPSGDAIAQEILRYLRKQDNGG